jgi:hypothetical protein
MAKVFYYRGLLGQEWCVLYDAHVISGPWPINRDQAAQPLVANQKEEVRLSTPAAEAGPRTAGRRVP